MTKKSSQLCILIIICVCSFFIGRYSKSDIIFEDLSTIQYAEQLAEIGKLGAAAMLVNYATAELYDTEETLVVFTNLFISKIMKQSQQQQDFDIKEESNDSTNSRRNL